ncbi:MAG TPA: HNH endonuclease signature motif containing protein [Burkholderiaceae bacterium]|nr:HNH endonuclease signature motif containing protein [Burkholderiaceae bacterium]
MPNAIKTHRPTLHLPKRAKPTGRDADPRRTIALNTAKWQRLRALVLAERPLCAHCFELGRVTIATDVDHADGNPANNLRSNLQSLCHSCHSTKTMRERSGSAAVFGCDVNGTPLDPKHAWNKNRQQPAALDRAPSLADAPAKLTGRSVT